MDVERRKQLAELLGAWLQDLQDWIDRVDGYTTDVDVGENFVLHGDTPPSTLAAAKLHRNLLESDGDLHEPKTHTHAAGSLSGWEEEVPTVDPGDPLVYTLTGVPVGTPILMVNHQVQYRRTAAGPTIGYYDLSGLTITYEKLPATINNMFCWYRTA